MGLEVGELIVLYVSLDNSTNEAISHLAATEAKLESPLLRYWEAASLIVAAIAVSKMT